MKKVLITGCTNGLGRALTDAMIAAGHQAAGCGRNRAAIETLQNTYGDAHHFDVVDISQDQEVAGWHDKLSDLEFCPDYLINNAGVINENAPLWEIPAEEIQQVLDINVAGTVNTIRHFLPDMLGRGTGIIVNFSSGWGRSVSLDVSVYCASKWAIEGLTKSLASELPDGMAAVPLNPGIIDTDMLRSCFGSSASAYPTPDQWAEIAVPMILSISERDNGASLTVSAG